MATTKRTVEIEAIGRLWMPMVEVAFDRKYEVGKGPWKQEIHNLDDVERILYSSSSEGSGDFSEIVDYQVYYVIERAYTRDGVVGVILHTRAVLAKAWEKEESEYRYEDLTAPSAEY